MRNLYTTGSDLGTSPLRNGKLAISKSSKRPNKNGHVLLLLKNHQAAVTQKLNDNQGFYGLIEGLIWHQNVLIMSYQHSGTVHCVKEDTIIFTPHILY